MNENNIFFIMATIGTISILLIAYLWYNWKKYHSAIVSYFRPEIYNQITPEDIENERKEKIKKDFSRNEERLKRLKENDDNYIPEKKIITALILNEKDNHNKYKS